MGNTRRPNANNRYVTNSSFFVSTLLLQFSVAALVWLLAARTGLARRAAMHWSAGSALVGLSLLLLLVRGEGDHWIGHGVAPMLAMLGFVLLLRGLERFARADPADRLHAGLVVGTTLGAVVLEASGADHQAAGVIFFAALACALVPGSMRIAHELSAELGDLAARLVTLPMSLAGALFGAWALLLAATPEQIASASNGLAATRQLVGYVCIFAVTGLSVGFAAMVVRRLVLKLQRASMRDALTGMLNRRGLEDSMQRDAGRPLRRSRGFAVLSVEIDHLRSINAQHGHAAGDAVLESMARTLMSQSREIDRVARVGGARFCVVLAHTDEAAAALAAQRLIEAVRKQLLDLGGTPLRCTVSVGVAVADDAGQPVKLVAQWADDALTLAQREGRDRARLLPRALQPEAAAA